MDNNGANSVRFTENLENDSSGRQLEALLNTNDSVIEKLYHSFSEIIKNILNRQSDNVFNKNQFMSTVNKSIEDIKNSNDNQLNKTQRQQREQFLELLNINTANEENSNISEENKNKLTKVLLHNFLLTEYKTGAVDISTLSKLCDVFKEEIDIIRTFFSYDVIKLCKSFHYKYTPREIKDYNKNDLNISIEELKNLKQILTKLDFEDAIPISEGLGGTINILERQLKKKEKEETDKKNKEKKDENKKFEELQIEFAKDIQTLEQDSIKNKITMDCNYFQSALEELERFVKDNKINEDDTKLQSMESYTTLVQLKMFFGLSITKTYCFLDDLSSDVDKKAMREKIDPFKKKFKEQVKIIDTFLDKCDDDEYNKLPIESENDFSFDGYYKLSVIPSDYKRMINNLPQTSEYALSKTGKVEKITFNNKENRITLGNEELDGNFERQKFTSESLYNFLSGNNPSREDNENVEDYSKRKLELYNEISQGSDAVDIYSDGANESSIIKKYVENYNALEKIKSANNNAEIKYKNTTYELSTVKIHQHLSYDSAVCLVDSSKIEILLNFEFFKNLCKESNLSLENEELQEEEETTTKETEEQNTKVKEKNETEEAVSENIEINVDNVRGILRELNLKYRDSSDNLKDLEISKDNNDNIKIRFPMTKNGTNKPNVVELYSDYIVIEYKNNKRYKLYKNKVQDLNGRDFIYNNNLNYSKCFARILLKKEINGNKLRNKLKIENSTGDDGQSDKTKFTGWLTINNSDKRYIYDLDENNEVVLISECYNEKIKLCDFISDIENTTQPQETEEQIEEQKALNFADHDSLENACGSSVYYSEKTVSNFNINLNTTEENQNESASASSRDVSEIAPCLEISDTENGKKITIINCNNEFYYKEKNREDFTYLNSDSYKKWDNPKIYFYKNHFDVYKVIDDNNITPPSFGFAAETGGNDDDNNGASFDNCDLPKNKPYFIINDNNEKFLIPENSLSKVKKTKRNGVTNDNGEQIHSNRIIKYKNELYMQNKIGDFEIINFSINKNLGVIFSSGKITVLDISYENVNVDNIKSTEGFDLSDETIDNLILEINNKPTIFKGDQTVKKIGDTGFYITKYKENCYLGGENDTYFTKIDLPYKNEANKLFINENNVGVSVSNQEWTQGFTDDYNTTLSTASPESPESNKVIFFMNLKKYVTNKISNWRNKNKLKTIFKKADNSCIYNENNKQVKINNVVYKIKEEDGDFYLYNEGKQFAKIDLNTQEIIVCQDTIKPLNIDIDGVKFESRKLTEKTTIDGFCFPKGLKVSFLPVIGEIIAFGDHVFYDGEKKKTNDLESKIKNLLENAKWINIDDINFQNQEIGDKKSFTSNAVMNWQWDNDNVGYQSIMPIGAPYYSFGSNKVFKQSNTYYINDNNDEFRKIPFDDNKEYKKADYVFKLNDNNLNVSKANEETEEKESSENINNLDANKFLTDLDELKEYFNLGENKNEFKFINSVGSFYINGGENKIKLAYCQLVKSDNSYATNLIVKYDNNFYLMSNLSFSEKFIIDFEKNKIEDGWKHSFHNGKVLCFKDNKFQLKNEDNLNEEKLGD